MAALELPALLLRSVASVTESARLVLINRSPEPNEVGVPVDSTIALDIVDLGPAGVSLVDTRILVNGAVAFDGGSNPPIAATFQGPESGVFATADSLRVVLQPVTPFGSLSVVTVRVTSRTSDGL